MEDREIVAAIVAGDLAALGDAYDQYAESLYGYCRWVLNKPDDAADAVQDTFVITAGMLGGLRDSRKLRPWLYAVARNECRRRRHGSQLRLDAAADLAGPAADVHDSADRAELRRLVQAALAGLNPAEQEVLELSLRHDLHGADLAAVLGVSRNQAHALFSRARGQLEKALGVLLVARTGRRGCGPLDRLLADSGGRLTAHTRKEVSRHIDQCESCADRRRGVLRPAALFGMTPLVALPRWLRREVLGLCADDSDVTLAYRHEVMLRAGPLRPNGFPQAIRGPRRMVALARVAAAAGIVIALASAGIISALALGGAHAPHPLAGARPSAGSATAGAAETTGAAASDVTPPAASPSPSPPEAVEQAPATVPSVSAKPSPSRSASSSASPQPKPTPSPSSPTPGPTPTPTPTPSSTGTPLPTPTPTPSFSF